MRVIKDGVQQKEASIAITGATAADPVVITAVNTYTNGDEVYISGVLGMTELNGRWCKVANVTGTTFELQLMDGSTNLDGSAFTAYSSGGTSEKVYEIVTTYTAPDLAAINYVQSADTITLVHPSYPPAELTRTGDTAWALADISFIPTVGHPTGVTLTPYAGTDDHSYIITAISFDSAEESLNGTSTVANAISGISKANPAVVTVTTSHPFNTGDLVHMVSPTGMVEVNGVYTVTSLTGTTYELDNTDSTNFGTFIAGQTTHYNAIQTTALGGTPTLTNPHVLSWTKPTGGNIREYNIYKETNGVFGLLGISQSLGFNDIGSAPNTSFTPPTGTNPFVGTDNYPSTVTYIQQRLTFANTNNKTEDIFMSKIGNFKNFTTSSPSKSDDAITFNMAGRQINEVKAMIDLGRLVVLTNGGEWSIEGENGVITPTTLNPKQYSYNGSGDVQPIIIDGAAIYQQARGSIIRDLGYDFQTDGYKGNDLTLFSAHLFDGFTFTDWAYQQIPHSILWIVRSDGVLLGMTYVRNHQVIAWHRHDLGGQVENVTVVPEGAEDVVYVTVRRTINSKVVRFVERLADRQETLEVDLKLMDSNLSYDGRNTSATTMTLSLDSGGWLYTDTLTCTASTAYFTALDVGKGVHITSGDDLIRCEITAYTSTTVVTVTPHKTVPTSLQTTALTTWSLAVASVSGLHHLEGEDISVFGDGYVVASPNNDEVDTITVTAGIATLARPYAVIHAGIPFTSDVETLNIDTHQGETIADKKSQTNIVNVFVEDTRGLFAGIQEPAGVLPLEDLNEFKVREDEDYDSPVRQVTDTIKVNIKSEWNNHGRVFLRQVDPVPFTILAIFPAGAYPFKGGK